MTEESKYVPPKVWVPPASSGGTFAAINRPTAGPTHEKALPVGKHPLQLYSLGTPNGVKVTIMLEELLALGHAGAEYDAWLIKINEGEQFSSGFVDINPELEDSGAGRPQRRATAARVRIGLDPAVPRGEVRRFPAEGKRGAHRDPELAVLANGIGAVRRRRLRPLLCLCAGEARISDRPLRDGSEAPARRARSPARRAPLRRGRRVHHRRHGDLAVVWLLVRGDLYEAASSCRCTNTCMSSAGPTTSPRGRPSSAAARSIAIRGKPEDQVAERHSAADLD